VRPGQLRPLPLAACGPANCARFRWPRAARLTRSMCPSLVLQPGCNLIDVPSLVL